MQSCLHGHHYEQSAAPLDARTRWRQELQSLKDKVDAMDKYLASMEARDASRGVKRRRSRSSATTPSSASTPTSAERVVPAPPKRAKRAPPSQETAHTPAQEACHAPATPARQVEDRLDAMYSEVDSVFRSVRARPLKTGYRELQVRSRGSEGRMVRVLDARMMPSALATTASLIWKHMLETSLGPNGASHSNLVTEDTIRAAISTTVLTPHGKGVFQGSIAMRRHVEPRRVVLLWNALLRPLEVDGLHMGDLVVQHADASPQM
ncbi:hypothetical protein P43SY_004724 [Pythium insidiosum]|uniref:Uncharacterized protein n=1 Tax=Pythium insidiosum TaxID=114742 RepID=A0AAD5LVG3_PYTIN|nr:hypothetical protein P43SY_004724 [Pythium insidiosum]